MGMPKSIRDTGVSEADFYARLTEMVGQAFYAIAVRRQIRVT